MVKIIKLNMVDYFQAMVNDFPEGISELSYLWNKNLFNVDNKSLLLSKEKCKLFHTFVTKGLFFGKGERPYIQLSITLLATRVQ
jgi:hypothetical protein